MCALVLVALKLQELPAPRMELRSVHHAMLASIRSAPDAWPTLAIAVVVLQPQVQPVLAMVQRCAQPVSKDIMQFAMELQQHAQPRRPQQRQQSGPPFETTARVHASQQGAGIWRKASNIMWHLRIAQPLVSRRLIVLHICGKVGGATSRLRLEMTCMLSWTTAGRQRMPATGVGYFAPQANLAWLVA